MTIQEAQDRVAAIKAAMPQHDNEKMHEDEDELLHDILRAIANGTAEDPAGLARAALAVIDLDYGRWYA